MRLHVYFICRTCGRRKRNVLWSTNNVFTCPNCGSDLVDTGFRRCDVDYLIYGNMWEDVRNMISKPFKKNLPTTEVKEINLTCDCKICGKFGLDRCVCADEYDIAEDSAYD